MGNLSQLLSECASFVKMAWLSHPPLQSPTHLLWVTPWAREEESPRRVGRRDAAAALWCPPKVADLIAYDHADTRGSPTRYAGWMSRSSARWASSDERPAYGFFALRYRHLCAASRSLALTGFIVA